MFARFAPLPCRGEEVADLICSIIAVNDGRILDAQPEYWITAEDGRRYSVSHYNLQVIIALGFKIDNERAVQFRKWANRIVGDFTIRGYVMDKERFKNGTPLQTSILSICSKTSAKFADASGMGRSADVYLTYIPQGMYNTAHGCLGKIRPLEYFQM